MANYKSIANTVETVGNTLVLVKPSGVVDGDLMIAVIGWDNGIARTLTTLAGWTLVQTDSQSVGQTAMATYYKVASSEGASFTWTFSGSTTSWGATVRIDTYNQSSPIATSNKSSTDSSASPTNSLTFSDSVTPSSSNSLILFPIFSANGSSANPASISSQAITTDNPTWTEILDYNQGADDYVLNISYANRIATTSTGNSNATLVGGAPGAKYFFSQKIVVGEIPTPNNGNMFLVL